MSLQNLQAIGRLKPHAPNAQELRRLLDAAARNLRDAGVSAISDETRFDAAYKAIMQCALAAMMAKGFRPSTNEPGHHQTLIQALPLTLGVDQDCWVLLDALRRRRNANDYTGDVVTPDKEAECQREATALLAIARQALDMAAP